MRAALSVDELGVDPHLSAIRLRRTFKHIAHAQVLADGLGVDRQGNRVKKRVTT